MSIQYLNGIAYCVEGSYSHPLRFSRKVSEFFEFKKVAPSEGAGNAILDALDKIQSLETTSKKRLEQMCLVDDLRLITEFNLKNSSAISTEKENLFKMFELVLSSYAALGVDVDGVNFDVLSDFPSPYSGFEFWAMSYDISDNRKYGLTRGIFLKDMYLMPFYSVFLMAHEVIHSLIGKNDSPRLARGLEDGIGDVLGSLVVASNIIPYDICEMMLRHSRFHYPQGKFWQIYRDNLLRCLALHEIVGAKGLANIVQECQNGSRAFVKELELNLHLGNLDHVKSLIGSEVAVVDERVSKTYQKYSVFPQTLVVSPTAFQAAKVAKLGMRVNDIADTLQVTKTIAQEALEELQNETFLIMVSDGKISADETKEMLTAGVLRYNPQP